MTDERTYLDWNATAPLRPQARAAMVAALDCCGNPASVHGEGRRARAIVETAREQIAALVGVDAGQVVLTSGATEANAMVLAGRAWSGMVLSGMEHPSMRPSGDAAAARWLFVPASADGCSRLDELHAASLPGADGNGGDADGAGPLLASHHLVNGETGVIHDVARFATLCRTRWPGAFVHTDAAQAAGRIPVDFKALDVDALTLSAHKIGGPKGAGALVLRRGMELAPLLRGGGQEHGRRAGTENVAAIAGFGAAAEVVRGALADESARLGKLQDELEAGVRARAPEAVVIGRRAPRVAGTSCIALPGRSAELLVVALDLAGIAVSAGAACSSGKVGASATLAAMGLEATIRQSVIRVSLGWGTTKADVLAFLAAWRSIAAPGQAAA